MMRAFRFSGGERPEPWLEYGLPWVLAFTAVVLALGLADRMLGSVTLDLVQDAPVPVTVVRPAERDSD